MTGSFFVPGEHSSAMNRHAASRSLDASSRGLYLEKVLPAHQANLREDYHTLLDEVNNRNAMRAIDKFIEERMKTTYIVIDPLFQGCDFERKGWVK